MNIPKGFYQLLLGLIISLCQTIALASGAQVVKIRYANTPERTRIVLDLSEKINYQVNAVGQRVSIRLNDTELSADINLPSLKFTNTPIKSLQSTNEDGALNINVDLQHVVKLQYFWLSNPSRLVLDLYTIKTVPVKKNQTAPILAAKPPKPVAQAKPTSLNVMQPTKSAPVTKKVPPKAVKSHQLVATVKPANAIANTTAAPATTTITATATATAVNNSSTSNNVTVVENPEEITAVNNDESTKIAEATASEETIKGKSRDIIVVIDPGHGGKDPGACGIHGSKEKNIVLGVAKALQNTINKTRGFRAYLTRNGDYFVPLRRRLDIAHQYKANMFIAIHADAFNESNSHGASIFAVSQRGATSEAARWLAEKENESELGQAMYDKSAMLRSVLIDLEQTATIGASLEIGKSMLNGLKKFTRLHSSRVEQAAFVVLKSPDIPSLLVETGFISDAAWFLPNKFLAGAVV